MPTYTINLYSFNIFLVDFGACAALKKTKVFPKVINYRFIFPAFHKYIKTLVTKISLGYVLFSIKYLKNKPPE